MQPIHQAYIEYLPFERPIVASEGFEPPKVSRLIYSQIHLAALVTRHCATLFQK